MGFAGDSVYFLLCHVVQHVLAGVPVMNTARDYLKNLRIEDAIAVRGEWRERGSLRFAPKSGNPFMPRYSADQSTRNWLIELSTSQPILPALKTYHFEIDRLCHRAGCTHGIDAGLFWPFTFYKNFPAMAIWVREVDAV